MKRFIRENKDNVIIGVISLITFIVGCFTVNPILAFIIVGGCDIVLFIPNLVNKQNTTKTKTLKIKEKNKTKHKKEKSKKKKIWKKILLVLLILCILGIISVAAFIGYIIATSPTFNPDNLYKQESSIFYFKNGDVMATLGTENRELVTYDELPEVLVDAIVATEDSRFFEHSGVDWARFIKATLLQLLGQSEAGGASTLTMQISKNDFTDTTASGLAGIVRKFKDVHISMSQIEKKYTKEEIMEFYVNSYYLGGGAYGVEQACQTYFGKSVSDINLAEASIIAGLFQLPGKYDPLLYPEKTEARRKTVLSLMVRHGYITEEEKNAALAIPVTSLLTEEATSNSNNTYLAAIDTIREDLIDKYGEENGNPYKVAMEVYTTIDKEKQDYLDDIMSGKTWTWENDKVTAGIAVLDVKDGSVAAIGAGRDRGALSFNTATMTSKQIGSTAKPLYDYGPGIEYENWSTYTPFPDEPYAYSDGTEINNWDVKYEGFLTARTALAHSRNTSALKAFQKNKNSNVKTFVTALGLHPEEESGSIHEAHAIGGYTGESPLSMAAAYSAFANGGYYIKPYTFTKVVYRSSGETVENEVSKTKVMGEDTAYMVYDMLLDAAKYGLGNQYSVNGATFGAKTGTSNFTDDDKKLFGLPSNAINDYWVDGVSPDYAISVWYGYKKVYSTKADASEENYCKNCYNTINETYHRKLFQAVAKGFFKAGSTITKPSNVVEVEIENETYPAQLPSEYTPSNMKITELFKAGTEPTEKSTRYSKLENVTNLKGTVENNELTLSWTAIEKPAAIDETKLKEFFSKFWKETSIPLNARRSVNNSTIGSLTYKVYSKDSSGNLKLIGSTEDTKYKMDVTKSSPTTYVVKSSYSIFTANASDGTTVTVDLDNAKADEIKASLNGTNPYVWTGSYTESGVKVLENNEDMTSAATVEISYTDPNNKKTTIDNIKTTGTYTVTYKITYKTFSKTLTRTVVVP